MTSGDLNVTEVDSGVEHRGDERVLQHARMRACDVHSAGVRKVPRTAGGGVPVHPGPAGVEQDRPRGPAADGAVDGTADGGSGISTILVPLPHTRRTRWPCPSPRAATLAVVASKIRR